MTGQARGATVSTRVAPERPVTPALFVSHGSPMVALDDDEYTAALGKFAAARPAPRAIVCVSAHWQAPWPVRVTGSPRPRLIYDFAGFPPALYRLGYPAPGAPDLAIAITRRLSETGLAATLDPERGLDHGAWVPLRHLYPEASVPVVAVSLPTAPPADLIRLGRALAPLREEGVLVMGSGGVVHNLGRLHHLQHAPTVAPWARAFDEWVRARLGAGDVPALAAYLDTAPHARLAVPTSEHFDPLLVIVGAARPGERVSDVYEGFQHGTLSMRSFAYGAAGAGGADGASGAGGTSP